MLESNTLLFACVVLLMAIYAEKSDINKASLWVASVITLILAIGFILWWFLIFYFPLAGKKYYDKVIKIVKKVSGRSPPKDEKDKNEKDNDEKNLEDEDTLELSKFLSTILIFLRKTLIKIRYS